MLFASVITWPVLVPISVCISETMLKKADEQNDSEGLLIAHHKEPTEVEHLHKSLDQ